jgi:hypothetical protein
MATLVENPREARAHELHVLPDASSGSWRVARSDRLVTVSWHSSADEATRAARRGAARIYLHDRYQRVRRIEP